MVVGAGEDPLGVVVLGGRRGHERRDHLVAPEEDDAGHAGLLELAGERRHLLAVTRLVGGVELDPRRDLAAAVLLEEPLEVARSKLVFG